MQRYLITCGLIALVAATTGCAMCGSPFDYSYAAYGGKWQRGDSDNGRVGSAFDPAEVATLGEGETIISEGEPTPADDTTQPPPDEPAAPNAAGTNSDPPPTPPGV